MRLIKRQTRILETPDAAAHIGFGFIRCFPPPSFTVIPTYIEGPAFTVISTYIEGPAFTVISTHIEGPAFTVIPTYIEGPAFSSVSNK
jgi:hypothetical protein